MMPEQDRSALELRITELTARMKSLDHLCKPGNVAEWAELYELREALEKSLDALPESLDRGPLG